MIHVIIESGEHGPTVKVSADDDAPAARIEYMTDVAVARWRTVSTWYLPGLRALASTDQ